MKNKETKINIQMVVLCIIAAILTLFILSITAKAALQKGDKTTLDNWVEEKKSCGDFARYITYHPNGFLNLDADTIFGLSWGCKWIQDSSVEAGGYYYGWYGSAEEPLNHENVIATHYGSTICLFHGAGQLSGSNPYGKITNVIDFDETGDIKVYYEEEEKIKLLTKDLTEAEKEIVARMSYLLNKSTKYREEYNETTKTWPSSGTFDKDLTDDNNIDGWDRMFHGGGGHPLAYVKGAIVRVMLYGGIVGKNSAGNDVLVDENKTNSLFSIFQNCKVDSDGDGDVDGSDKSVINQDYSGWLNGTIRNEVYSTATAGVIEELKKVEENTLEHTGEKICELENLTPKAQYIGDNAYIGPFGINYSGGTLNVEIGGVTISGWAKCTNATNGTFTSTTSLTDTQNPIPTYSGDSQNQIYIVVPASQIKDKETVNVNFSLKYDFYRTRMVFTRYSAGSAQNLMFYASIKDEAELNDSCEVQLDQTIAIQKQDSSGKALKVAGIQFEVYDSANKKLGTLITDSNGKTTIVKDASGNAVTSLKLEVGKTYKIKETLNNAYGYKGRNVSGASIISGGGQIVSVADDGTITFKITQTSVIGIKNVPALGNLTIHKTGEDGTNLAGVQFVLYKGDGYLKLNDKSVNTPIETPNSGIDITSYTGLTTVTSASQATKFKTNSSGKIVINNLEIYSAKDTKYVYWLQEVSNTLYGYKGMVMSTDDVTVSGGNKSEVRTATKEVKFDITANTTITIENHKELGNVEIIKQTTKADGTQTVLSDVEFKIQRNNKYIQLKDKNGNVINENPIIGIATINSENSASKAATNEYTIAYVDSASAATTFKTDENGKTGINNLEVNASTTSKYSYTAIETSNRNYGYGATIGADIKETVQLTLNQTAIITIDNTKELGNIEIIKQTTEADGTQTVLRNVEFKIQRDGKYIQLKDKNGNIIKQNPIIGIATINAENLASKAMENEYIIGYVTTASEATIFKTDANGKTGLNNLEVNKSSTEKYSYTAIETSNRNYGYGATIGADIKETIQLTLNEKVTITIDNTQELANIEIIKTGENENNLENVEFVIQRGTNEYLQIKDSDGKPIPPKKGSIIIDLETYSVGYVANKDDATRFVTDENGKITINNLEVNKSSTEKYAYTAYEVNNPNYGYGSSANTALSGTVASLTLNATTQIPITNTIDLGNISLLKYDEENADIKLGNVGFTIEMIPSPSGAHAYLALYNAEGKLEQSINDEATINRKNIANDTEYEVRPYYTEKAISEMTEEEKENLMDNITLFVTKADGTLVVNNLEVYVPGTANKYTYKLIEVSNSNYGFIANGQNVELTLESNSTVAKELTNKQTLTKISGYVWVENPLGKSNNYDYLYQVYTEENQSKDIILKDLYLTDENGKVIELNKNPEAVKAPVEVKLYNKKTNSFVKTAPDEFSADGKYTFTEVNIEELENYQVVFEYNGFYYTTTIPNINQDNGSKVQEVAEERTDLNNLFGKVKDNNEVISVTNENGQNAVNTVTYSKDKDETILGHESTVSELNFNTIISANTTQTEYNLKTKYDESKTAGETSAGIENINMGIVLREQPKLMIGSDIYSVSIDVKDNHYDYYYNGRQEHYNNINGDLAGVKFEQEEATNRYTRPVYSSDVQSYNNGLATMEVSLIYKMQITNQSGTLTSVVRELANYFDSDYTVEEIGLSLSNNVIGNKLDENIWSTENIITNVPVENPDEGKSYNSIRIPLSENGEEGLALEKGQSKHIYIKYKVSENAIKGLLSGKSTYHNATEIMSYSTYYGALTGKQIVDEQEQYCVTEQGREGEIYAGIDKSSQPGNIELKLIEDTRDEEGTKILDTSNYEDDTTSAPALLLEPTTTRKIAGTIFEDKATAQSLENKEKLGNGIYDSNEYTIDGVKVELYNLDGTLAKYSNGEDAIAITDGKGNYTFGTNDIGIVPGDYFIQYTYNNESYIVDTSGNIVKYLKVNDYKSTIITSNVIKSAINNAETIEFDGTTYPRDKWYIIKETHRYSDAIDNIDLRNTLDNDEVKYSTYQNSFEPTYVMKAVTPVIDVGIEFTVTNESQVDTTDLDSMRNRVETLENVDFGIIERPDANIIIEKQITGLEVTTQTGTNIIPKGDPSNPNVTMQYVKTGLDGLVSAEIEAKILQGASLNLEYSITATNACQTDYTEPEYYLYGTGGATKRTMKVKKVVDYLDKTMTPDTEKNAESWTTETTAQDLYENGYISEDVYKSLTANGGNFHILLTEEFNELENPGDSKTVKLYATKYLAASSEINEENSVEIIELTGGRTIKESIPGNYDPATNSPDEPDDDMVELIVTPPTGTTVNYTIYITAVTAMFIILVLGIIIIKKKVIRQ